MSLWHSPQSLESMKKLDGMRPLVLVRADDGQKGDLGPSPSACMEAGTTFGLRMRSGAGPRRSARARAAATARAGVQRGRRIARPATLRAMWAMTMER